MSVSRNAGPKAQSCTDSGVYGGMATTFSQPGRLSGTVFVLSGEVFCPVLHDFAALVEYVASCVGLFGCGSDAMGEA